ncbi:hypothetical protein A9W98_03175 [Mycobacterium gordonae]|uniref:ATPase n=1 Tax=Mycobacterium gordonae TaxID=1778 RepID=A0A1A6B7K3_MYCGO|nr:hypothetical protein A9W98_03175 [Mycobacterium gordonae]
MRGTSAERRHDGRVRICHAHGCGIRRTGHGAEVGRATVSYQNIVGLVLAVLIAAFLVGALLFPERF